MKKILIALVALAAALGASAATTKTIWEGDFCTDKVKKDGVTWQTWKNILDLGPELYPTVAVGDKFTFVGTRRDASIDKSRIQINIVDGEYNWICVSSDADDEGSAAFNAPSYTLTVTESMLADIRRGMHIKGENIRLSRVEWTSNGSAAGDVHIAEGNFRVSGTKLLDANNNEFIMRGCNYSWCWQRGNEGSVIPAAKRIGCNAIRIQLGDGKQYYKPSKAELEYLISLCEQNKLIAVFNTHDETGSNEYSDLERAAKFWIEMKDVLNAHTSTVIVNISNEWMGAWNRAQEWADGYKKVIPMMRDAGIKNTLVVDCEGYGQWPASMFSYGRDVFEADKDRNLMLSIHFYDSAGASDALVRSNIDKSLALNVPLLIGEFAYQHKGNPVAWQTILDYSKEKSVGYLVWSWTGNGNGTEDCDMFGSYDDSQYRENGTKTVLGRNGIKETSQECTVFDPDATKGEDPKPDDPTPVDPKPDDSYIVIDTYTPSSPVEIKNWSTKECEIPASAFAKAAAGGAYRLNFSQWKGGQVQVVMKTAPDWTWTPIVECEDLSSESMLMPLGAITTADGDSFTADEYISTLRFGGLYLKGQNYTFTSMEILSRNSAFIDAVDADVNAPVEIYNLQGIRVAEMTPGNIYIVRQGSKVKKVVK